jgi:hypothetical protein
MARSITWNGMTLYRPGGLTRINSSALAQIGLSTNGIIGLVGEAEGGEPGTIITIDDPASAEESFLSGPLADAIQIAFDPSNDPRIPGGAFRCLCIRTNQGTPATLTVYNRYYSGLTTTGSSTTIINLAASVLVIDAAIGSKITIAGETRTITDNTANTVTVGTAFSTAPGGGATVEILAPMMILTSKDYGSHTNRIRFEFEPGITRGEVWTNELDDASQVSQDLGGKAYLQVEYVGQSVTTTLASGTSSGGGASTLTDSTAAWGTDAFQNLFVLASGGGVGATPNLRKVASNTSTQITVTNAWSNPASGSETYSVLKGKIHAGTATAGAASTITLEATLNLALNELAGMQIVLMSGTGSGQRRTITSHTAGASSVITVDYPWTTQPIAGTTYEIRYVTKAKGSFIGSTGVATKFQTSVAVNGAAAATDLNITFDPGESLYTLVAAINANADYVATIPSGVNNQTTLMSSFDFDLGNTDVELRNDKSTVTSQPNPSYSYTVPWPNCFKRDLQVAIDDITSKSNLVTAARATTTPISGAGRPAWTGGSAGTVGDVYESLSGGTRGVSTNTDFQNALDTLLGVRCNFVVPLISYDLSADGYGSTATFASVAAQLSAHCSLANGIGKSERGGLLGMEGTKTALLSEAASLNSEDIQLCGQQIEVLDVTGTLAVQPEWSLAVAAAGMRAGAPEVGEPLTHKYIQTNSLTQDSSWDPLDRTDANELIGGGILFAEYIQGKGTRFVRDITTYIQDDNLALMEGSVRDCVRYIAYGLRTALEDKYTGVKATPANASGMKQTAATWLDAANADNICVTSLNAKGEQVPGYENLRVTISGDIATVKVQVYPAVGINWELNDIYLQLPRQSA